jgi:hypothetical protein
MSPRRFIAAGPSVELGCPMHRHQPVRRIGVLDLSRSCTLGNFRPICPYHSLLPDPAVALRVKIELCAGHPLAQRARLRGSAFSA